MAKITLYHHTNKKGAKGIERSMIINQSDGGGDAAFGTGVYLTAITPESAKDAIAYNNYDDGDAGWFIKLLEGHVDYVVKITLPLDWVTQVDSDRNIWLYEDDDLDLDDEEVKFNIKKVTFMAI